MGAATERMNRTQEPSKPKEPSPEISLTIAQKSPFSSLEKNTV
jgi:hypothetical protein